MYTHKFNGTSLFFLFFLLFHILLIPFGCTTTPQLSRPVSSPPPPSYEIGTTYVYSDGSWETVAGISPQLVTWHDHRGNVYSRSPDFTYRALNWQTKTGQGSRRFVPRGDFVVQNTTSLWPLQKGNVASFTEMVTSSKIGEAEKSYQRRWSCEVIGTERVAVMAGEFDTWKIVCKRYNNYQNPSKAKIREMRTWNYAPEIKHYVLTQRQYFTGKPARQLELLAVLPPSDKFTASARDQKNKTFQMAMEFKKSGESAQWSIPETSWSGEITPTGTFKLADGRFCRRYVQKVKFWDGPRVYYGLAVRNPDGVWVVPRHEGQ